MKKLSRKQVEKLMWYFKDGVRISSDLTHGQREVLEEMRLYEDMNNDIDRQLEYFRGNGF